MGPLGQAGGSAFVTMTLGMPLEVVMRRMQVGLHKSSDLFESRMVTQKSSNLNNFLCIKLLLRSLWKSSDSGYCHLIAWSSLPVNSTGCQNPNVQCCVGARQPRISCAIQQHFGMCEGNLFPGRPQELLEVESNLCSSSLLIAVARL
jgi:hypothetical protein